jgi:hypothetical protein
MDEEEEEEEQAFPDSGSLPPPQRGVRFRHRCEMCQVTLNSQKQMFEHFRGKKHVQGEERLRQMTGQGPSPATYPPSGQALNWQNQRDWRADDEMNWEREKARGWSKLPTPLSAIVKPEPRDDAGGRRAHEVSTGTERAQQPTCSVAGKQGACSHLSSKSVTWWANSSTGGQARPPSLNALTNLSTPISSTRDARRRPSGEGG